MYKHRFKVGDKVKIIVWADMLSDLAYVFGNCTRGRDEYCTIVGLEDSIGNEYCYSVCDKFGKFLAFEKELKSVIPCRGRQYLLFEL